MPPLVPIRAPLAQLHQVHGEDQRCGHRGGRPGHQGCLRVHRGHRRRGPRERTALARLRRLSQNCGSDARVPGCQARAGGVRAHAGGSTGVPARRVRPDQLHRRALPGVRRVRARGERGARQAPPRRGQARRRRRESRAEGTQATPRPVHRRRARGSPRDLQGREEPGRPGEGVARDDQLGEVQPAETDARRRGGRDGAPAARHSGSARVRPGAHVPVELPGHLAGIRRVARGQRPRGGQGCAAAREGGAARVPAGALRRRRPRRGPRRPHRGVGGVRIRAGRVRS